MDKVMEIVRIKQEKMESEFSCIIRHPDNVAELATKFIGDEDREVFLVICLNVKNNVVAVHRAHIGSLNASIVHAREVFKSAILNNSASIIVAHNHPSGNVEPSREDINVTKRLHEAGKILGIDLLDSLIVSDNMHNYYSLKERGYIG